MIEKTLDLGGLIRQEVKRLARAGSDFVRLAVSVVMADAQRGQAKASSGDAAFNVLASAFSVGSIANQSREGICFVPEKIETCALKFVQ